MSEATETDVQWAHDTYSEDDGAHFWPFDYTPILERIGTIALQVDEDDYQGDSYVLYRDGDRWGFLTFGWGSCSGCDALQACNSAREVAELYAELRGDVRWGTASEVKAILLNPARDGEWYAREESWLRFRGEAAKLLAGSDERGTA